MKIIIIQRLALLSRLASFTIEEVSVESGARRVHFEGICGHTVTNPLLIGLAVSPLGRIL